MKRRRFRIPDFPPDRPKVPDVVPLASRIMSGACTRPNGHFCLHVVLDDGNLDVSFMDDLMTYCPLCMTVAVMLRQMTPTQRRRVYMLAEYKELV